MAIIYYPNSAQVLVRTSAGAEMTGLYVDVAPDQIVVLSGSSPLTAAMDFITASYAKTASVAITASYVSSSNATVITASYADRSNVASTANSVVPGDPVYGPSASFNPVTSIVSGSCILWLKADSGSYVDVGKIFESTIQGDIVRHWDDQSGLGHHISGYAVEFSRCSYIVNTGPNGTCRAILNNPSTTHKFYSLSWGAQTKPYWLISAVRGAQYFGGTSGSCVIMDGLDGSNRFLAQSGWANQIYAGGSVISYSASLDNVWHVSSFKSDGVSSIIRVNGVQLATGNSGAQTIAGVNIGGDYLGNNSNPGCFLEIILYSQLDDSDVSRIENYLMSKYFITPT